jgi:hypothetical protein
MNPKEKAKEIYCKYTDALNIRDLQTTANPFAKQCALIAVDEILKINKLADENLNYKEYFNDCTDFKSYWQEVKQEIELTGGDK